MPNILAIDCSTDICSLALFADGQTVFERISEEVNQHSALLGGYVKEAFSLLHAEYAPLDAIAVGCGPGSYTGLRIAVSLAKGVCYGCGASFIALNSLFAIVCGALQQLSIQPGDCICPMIDARRMEVYTALYRYTGVEQHPFEEIMPVQSMVITANSFSQFSSTHGITFAGNGCEKCIPLLSKEGSKFYPSISPLASYMLKPAMEAYNRKQFADTAYFEPFYLKEFAATTPKRRAL
jgi:tRNA threonylcarbamoyladenosine biosynthesis protein TsaB